MKALLRRTEVNRPVRDHFLIFGSPLVGEDEIEEVVETLRSCWIGTGPKVAKFEEMFRKYAGSKHALALNSCTAGLHLSMIVSGLKPGDEVITTPMTFAATANMIHHVGATPVFADIELPSMNIDPEQIERKITKRTRAIIPVHFAGRPCRMDTIMEVAERHNLLVIEDAAHAIEAWYHGRKIGTIGDLTAFSFYATKNITTGEGGMVTTNNREWAEKIQISALHGMSKGAWKRYSDEGFKHYQVMVPGYRSNMMDLQAAIGIHQLKRIDQWLEVRNRIWARYDEAFADLPLETPPPPELDTVHARHLYTMLANLEELKADRDQIQQALYEENIGTGIHFVSLHLHPYYANTYGYKRGDFPNAEYMSDRTISLPLSPKLTDQDIEDVIVAVTRVLDRYAN